MCVVETLERAGLSAVDLLDAYEFMNRNHYPGDDETRLRRFDVMVYLLDKLASPGQTHQVGGTRVAAAASTVAWGA